MTLSKVPGLVDDEWSDIADEVSDEVSDGDALPGFIMIFHTAYSFLLGSALDRCKSKCHCLY